MNKAKFILSKKIAIGQYQQLKEHIDVVSYSSKTNPTVTPILEEHTDAMFNIHMSNELQHVTDKSRITFLAQAWDNAQIEELITLGCNHFIVDNEQDLDTLLTFLEHSDKTINLMLRIKIKEHSVKTERYFVFGMSHETILKRLPALCKHEKIKKVGLHFHRKTQNVSEWNLQYELEQLFSKEILQELSMINIGGGLPSVYANTNIDVINSIFNQIDSLRAWMHSFGIELWMEPGRFICAPAVQLVTRIIGKYENNLIVNASVYNGDTDAFVGPYKLKIKNELPQKQGEPYVIKGITPCSMDLFRYRVWLDNPQVGDELIFLNAGAYNFTTEFCDLDKLETEIIE